MYKPQKVRISWGYDEIGIKLELLKEKTTTSRWSEDKAHKCLSTEFVKQLSQVTTPGTDGFLSFHIGFKLSLLPMSSLSISWDSIHLLLIRLDFGMEQYTGH